MSPHDGGCHDEEPGVDEENKNNWNYQRPLEMIVGVKEASKI